MPETAKLNAVVGAFYFLARKGGDTYALSYMAPFTTPRAENN